MSQEIIEAVREIERDKGIEQGTLVVALEDALLAAYKKMPGASRHATVELGKVEALLPRSEQVDGERYEQGSRIKAVITEVRSGTKGPQVILSRRDPELIRTLFELAVAIGKEGMNARLAARLTGWKVDIKSDTEFATEEAEAAYAGEGDEEGEFTGRCAAVLSTGKRCPNAALPGSRYCGVPAHQELAHKEAELPAEAPAETPLATPEEVEQAEPVARVEEPPGDVAVATPFPREGVVEAARGRG